MHELATNAEAASDISTPNLSPKTRREPGARLWGLVEVAAKGLGLTGVVDMPQNIWDDMSPANSQWAAEGTPPSPRQLHRSPTCGADADTAGTTVGCRVTGHPPPNARAYVQHKNTQRCSLVLPMLGSNARCVEPLPFKMPTLDTLAHLLQLCNLRGDNSIIVLWTSSIILELPALGLPFTGIGSQFKSLGSPLKGMGTPFKGLGSPFQELGIPFKPLGSPIKRMGSPPPPPQKHADAACAYFLAVTPPPLREPWPCPNRRRCGFRNFGNHGIWWFHFLGVHDDEVLLVIWG